MQNEKRDALPKQPDEEFQRCKCNKLLCVVKGDDIEIKCNKCKRVMTIKTKGILDVEIKQVYKVKPGEAI